MTEHEVRETEVEVEIERSVRFGRLMIGGAIIGALVAVIVTLLYEIPEGALYEMRQIAGFMLVIGAAIGLMLGALLSLILHLVARRTRGSGIAIHRDVQ